MNLKELRELLELLIERGITEFEMERGSLKIRVKRDLNSPPAVGTPTPPPAVSVSPPAAPVSVAAPPASPAASPEPVSGTPADQVEQDPAEIFIVKSPMVGTFYRAPNPNAPPFVEVADVVEVGQVLCIVEAMKLMNEIESEVAGEIVRAYVENGQPVEYGESLFALRPSRKK